MTVAEYDQWKKDNPAWDKDWSKGVASAAVSYTHLTLPTSG